MIGTLPRFHGIVRGLDGVPSSAQFEGRFGRIFRTLPPARFTEDDLRQLALQMVAKDEGAPTPETDTDDEENTGISAGYTYLGQFIDHDITFDPASSLDKTNDPNALVDYRTPRFDLDSVYGRGPDDQPYLYQDDGLHFLLGKALTGNPVDGGTHDLPRNGSSGRRRALIGDPRNDENVIVSQLQGIFLRFHNALVDYLKGTDATFGDVQRFVRWHYQWVILHDFLPTIIGPEMLYSILPHLKSGKSITEDRPQLRFYNPRNDPFMPVEFSVAAYRFGHSMVRPIYRLNTTLADRFVIFSLDPTVPNLTGFGEFPSDRAIDWRLFFDFGNHPEEFSINRIQPAYKIDSSLVNPLGHLPPVIAAQVPSLAERNLLRGWRMGLPSGQAVARQMELSPISDDDLRVGKANKADHDTNPRLVDLSPRFKDNAPLWYYILAEAQQQFVDDGTPIHLGDVGGRIVGEVFVGLLLGDKHSFLNQDATWKPFHDFQNNGEFGIADLITQAQKA
jgi:Animal haem peroxidase